MNTEYKQTRFGSREVTVITGLLYCWRMTHFICLPQIFKSNR